MAVGGDELAAYGKQFVGTPYVWGGNSLSSGIDCSGLVQQVYKKFGISVPRVTYDQINVGKAIKLSGLRAGDMVFFDTEADRKGPDHVGIYLGNGKMLHAPRPGKNVEIVDMTQGYYMDRFMGGRRVAGIVAPNGKATDEETRPKLKPEELAAEYGFAYGFLKSQPELSRLFKEAVSDTWSGDKFQAKVRETKWWRENSETARKAQILKQTDPATYNAQLSATELQVRQLAAEVGAAVPDAKVGKLAKQIITTGLDEGGIRNLLGNYVTFTKNGTLKGEAGMHEFTIRQYAEKNGVQLSDETVKNQAQRIIRGLATTQDFESQIRDHAKSMFPSYADQLDAGLTMEDIASPYKNMMASELEMPEEALTVNDLTIKSALNGLDANGVPAGKNLFDFQTSLRNDPRWKKTKNAQNETMGAAFKVLSDMGMVTGGGNA